MKEKWLDKNPEMTTTEDLVKIAQTHCSSCGKNMEEDEAHLVAFKATIDKRFAGKMVLIETVNRKYTGFVPKHDSDAAKEGVDLGFMVCGEECSKELKSELHENDIITICELGNDRMN